MMGRVRKPPKCKEPTLPKMTEAQFQDMVIKLAKLYGWRVYHTYDSRRSVAGFPDLTLVRAKTGQLIMAELKTDTGRQTPEQLDWMEDLSKVAACDKCTCGHFSVAIWRPRDWEFIKQTLEW